MTHSPASSPKIDPVRAESIAGLGIFLQILATGGGFLFASLTHASVFRILQLQVGLGIFFWFLSWMHLYLRRSAREEAIDLERAERRRREQGLQPLFQEKEEGRAARNLRHFEAYFAPLAGILLVLALEIPFVLAICERIFPAKEAFPLAPGTSSYLFLAMVGAFLLAFFLFLLGTYSAGLSRETGMKPLRAGAGYSLSSAFALLLASLALALISKGWLGSWPDAAAAWLIGGWMSLQGIEMAVNLILDFYRPRLKGIEIRPAFDSRCSGLLAEPQGLFQTFAQTLDYQFGFRISETWFFHFLEKAILPLLGIQLGTLYLLTTIVVVRPGEAAIIERWGRPRGMDSLPSCEGDWSEIAKKAPPLGPGLHLKWPWPIEIARIVSQDRISTLTIGYQAESEKEIRKKAETLRKKLVTWDAEHVEGESLYLMPLVALPSHDAKEEKNPPREDSEKGERPSAPLLEVGDVDALLLAGEFLIEYTIGSRSAANLYRFLYHTADPEGTLRTIAEGEITAYLAGANFWDLLSGESGERIRQALQDRIRQRVEQEKLGIEIVYLGITNLHPPAGDVGVAFQKVIANEQERIRLLHEGEIEANRIVGLAPVDADKIVSEARASSFRRARFAEAEARWFRDQKTAWQAAPEAYGVRVRLRTIEEALADLRKILRPEGVTILLDDSKALTPTAVEKAIIKEVQRKR